MEQAQEVYYKEDKNLKVQSQARTVFEKILKPIIDSFPEHYNEVKGVAEYWKREVPRGGKIIGCGYPMPIASPLFQDIVGQLERYDDCQEVRDKTLEMGKDYADEQGLNCLNIELDRNANGDYFVIIYLKKTHQEYFDDLLNFLKQE